MSHKLWIGTQPEPDDRLQIEVEEDIDVHDLSDDQVVTVTDLRTGIDYDIRRADCGAGCRCALELVGEAA